MIESNIKKAHDVGRKYAGISESAVDSTPDRCANDSCEDGGHLDPLAYRHTIMNLVSGNISDTCKAGDESVKKASKLINSWILMTIMPKDFSTAIKHIEDSLNSRYPYFEEITSHVGDQLSVCARGRNPIKIDPILIVGSPGLGKTSYVEDLARLISLDCHNLDMGSTAANFIITGSHPSWASAKPGLISSSIIDSKYGNHIFILDELDKMQFVEGHSPEGGLLSLLESKTSKRFKDEYFVGLEFNTSYMSYISLANSINKISEPLLSRLKVFNARPPSEEESILVISHMFSDICVSNNIAHLFEEYDIREDREVLKMLLGLPSFREMKSHLISAVGKSIKNSPYSDKIILKKEYFAEQSSRGFGFL